MKLKNIHKILFITLSNIGDVILTLPVLSALKDNFPDAEIDVVLGPMAKEIFANDPRINTVFIYDKHAGLKQKLGFIRGLRGKRYNLAIDMRTSLIPFLIGAKNRSSLISINKGAARHKKLVHLNKLRNLGIGYKERRNIYIDDKDREKVRRLLEENGAGKDDFLIGLSPTCRSLLKQWHTEGFIEVIDSLLKNKNCKIVLIGDSTWPDVPKKIKDAVKNKNLIDLMGKTSLGELLALIERMQVLLTCDSACMHIACDLGVKVVAIFGPTDVKEYGPTGKDDVVIRKEIKCSPCRKAVCRLNHECMKGISPQEVLNSIKLI